MSCWCEKDVEVYTNTLPSADSTVTQAVQSVTKSSDSQREVSLSVHFLHCRQITFKWRLNLENICCNSVWNSKME